MQLQNAIQQTAETLGPWALVAVFIALFLQTANPIGVAVPGNPLVFGLGLLAKTSERFSLFEVVTTMALGAIFGCFAGVWTGQRIGPAFFAHPKTAPFLAKSEAFFAKHGGKAVAIAFFVPFLRCFVPVFAGANRVPMREVVAPAIVGGILWTGLFSSAGYAFGNLPGVRQNLDFAILALVILVGLQVAIKARSSRGKSTTDTAGA